MAQKGKSMELNSNSISNIAHRLIKIHKITPPVDIESLVKKYATLHYKKIPIEGIDGISLHLKSLSNPTIVIVNSNHPEQRQRFTLAHELGHIVIPWHTGSIIDHADILGLEETTTFINNYWSIEKEANIFAAELLVATPWVSHILTQFTDIAKAHTEIARVCNVSLQVAAIKLINYLPSNYVLVVEREGQIEYCYQTNGTHARLPSKGSTLDRNHFSYYEQHYVCTHKNRQINWWKLPSKMRHIWIDDRHWKEILDSIITELNISHETRKSMIATLNGVISYANNLTLRCGEYSRERLTALCIQRLSGHQLLAPLFTHKDFDSYLGKKIDELVQRHNPH